MIPYNIMTRDELLNEADRSENELVKALAEKLEEAINQITNLE